jgi:hypothetical protein
MYPLPALFASSVLLMAAAKKMPWKTSASGRHITNLKQSILETLISMVQTKTDKLTRQMGWSIDVHANN